MNEIATYNPDAFLEDRSLRDGYSDRIEVLDEVKGLTTLKDGINLTGEMVEDYYESSKPTIKSLLKENRDELMSVGMKTLEGDDLKEYKESYLKDPRYKKINSITLLPRKAILRVGMLLRSSGVAETVRSALLDEGKTFKDEYPDVQNPVRNSDLINTVNNLFRYQTETMRQHNEILRELIRVTNG